MLMVKMVMSNIPTGNSPESNVGSIDYAWYITSDGIANNSMSTITGSYGKLSAAIR